MHLRTNDLMNNVQMYAYIQMLMKCLFVTLLSIHPCLCLLKLNAAFLSTVGMLVLTAQPRSCLLSTDNYTLVVQ